MDRFKALDLHVVTKPDLTPVTDADQAVEDGIRARCRGPARATPSSARRTGTTGWGPRRWVVDPIDGTKNFVRGVPVWATLIGLMVEDEVVVGVVSAPALDRRWWAMKGGGAWTGKSLLRATAVPGLATSRAIEDASLSYSSLDGWEERGRLDDFLVAVASLLADPRVRRLLVLHAGRRGRGRHRRRARARALRHGRARRHRREAGGRFTSLDGDAGPARAATPSPPTAACTTQALAFLGLALEHADPQRGGTVHDLSARRGGTRADAD